MIEVQILWGSHYDLLNKLEIKRKGKEATPNKTRLKFKINFNT
jgi:hypothetical protein